MTSTVESKPFKIMIKAHRITHDAMDHLAGLYEQFRAEAATTYRWDLEPVPFEQLKKAIEFKSVRGYWVSDSSELEPVALMLFTKEEHRAIELNVIYIPTKADGWEAETKTMTDRLMRAMIKDLQEDASFLQTFDVISYAMLGKQAELVRMLPWYGFKPVGQAIVRFDIMDPISLQILKQQQLPSLPAGYTLTTWQPEYAGEVSKVIFESFSQASDSLWDPRFKTELGCRRAISLLVQGSMGQMHPDCTAIVLRDNQPVGACLLVQSDMKTGNIPLIGVLPSEKGKNLGNHLLKHTLDSTIANMLAGKLAMLSITATHDTDNIAAIKMYRRMGFREDDNYPHAYLSKEKLLSLNLSKWC